MKLEIKENKSNEERVVLIVDGKDELDIDYSEDSDGVINGYEWNKNEFPDEIEGSDDGACEQVTEISIFKGDDDAEIEIERL